MTPRLLLLGSALFLATSACSSPPESSSSTESADEAHPLWLVGSWTNSHSSNSDATRVSYRFSADGTGSYEYAKVYTYSGLTDARHDTFSWHVQGPDRLVMDGVYHSFQRNDDCTWMALDGLGLSGPHKGWCSPPPPLTPTEESLVGTWTFDTPPADNPKVKAVRGVLVLSTDRKVSFDFEVSYEGSAEPQIFTARAESWRADDHTLTATRTGTGEAFTLPLERKGDALDAFVVGHFLGHP